MKMYALLRKLLKGFFVGLFRVKVTGEENIPETGALLVCPNHISNWDPILLGAVMDRQILFMAKASLFKVPVLNTLIRALGAFPVNRGTADPSAIKTAVGYLKEGGAVGVFPQGTRFRGVEPKETEVKNGVGMIACRSGVDVLPVAVKTKGYKVMPFRRVYINIGKVIPYGELGIGHGNREEYSAASQYIFGKITELL